MAGFELIEKYLNYFKYHIGKEEKNQRTEPNQEYLKNDEVAKKNRMLGDDSFNAGHMKKAVWQYSCGIAAAKTEDELHKLYESRSKALDQLNYYDLAQLDRNRTNRGPASRRQKLDEQALMSRVLSIDFDPELEHTINNHIHSLIEDDKESAMSKIQEFLTEEPPIGKIKASMTRINRIPDDFETDYIIHKDDIDEIWQKPVKQLSHFVGDLPFSWTAHENIPPGEILSIEEYYAVAMASSACFSYCAYCAIWCEALIPCKGCCMEMYCSSKCREKAREAYHDIECKLFPFIGRLKMRRISLLAFRIYLIGTKGKTARACVYGKMTIDERVFCKKTRPSREPKPFSEPDRYLTLLSLIRKPKVNPVARIDPDILRDLARIFVAYVRVHKPKGTAKFSTSHEPESISEEPLNLSKQKTKIDLSLSSEEETIALLLLHHAALVSVCAEPVQIERLNKHLKPDRVPLGASFTFQQSFVEYSCDPNVQILTQGRKRLIYSLRPIKAGEKIYIPFCYNYGEKSLNERQVAFKAVFGSYCSCTACREGWPSIKKCDKEKVDLREYTYKGGIPVIEELYATGKYNLLLGNPEIIMPGRGLKWAQDFQVRVNQHLEQPSWETWTTEYYMKLKMLEKSRIRSPIEKRLLPLPSLEAAGDYSNRGNRCKSSCSGKKIEEPYSPEPGLRLQKFLEESRSDPSHH